MALVAAGAVMVGCASNPDTMIAPVPQRPWAVPDAAHYVAAASDEAAHALRTSDGPPQIDPARSYQLAELIDIAQRTNPETRIAWERARDAALGVGIAESAYAPVLAASAVAAAERFPTPIPTTVSPQGFFNADTQLFLPALTLKWLVFDAGGRQAAVDASKATLAFANFGFNAAHQKIVFDVTNAYYAATTAEDRIVASRASLSLAQALLNAVDARRGRGLATLPDVLQARERTASAEYDLAAALAGELDARMALLEAMGVRPTTMLRIAPLDQQAVPAMVEDTAEKLVERALAQRPDLLARVATIDAREAAIRKAKSDFYPHVAVAGNLLQNIGRFRINQTGPWASVNETGFGASLTIEIPLYDGGQRQDRLESAEAQRRIADGEFELARDQVVRQVVKAYEDLKLAIRQRAAALAMLTAAERSNDAAIDSYRNGIATFVDVTSAQTALTKARTTDADTKSAVFAAMASLAFSTGDLASP